MKFSQRVEGIQPSATVAVGNKASMLRQKGIDIIDLSVGEPDFKTPENIVKVAKNHWMREIMGTLHQKAF